MKPSMAVPAEIVTIYNNALALSNSGDYMPALDEYRRAIQLCPSFIEAYNNIGEIYSQMGDRQKAISTYIDALNIDRNYRVLLNLGVEYYNTGDFLSALNHFQESVSLKSDFLEGYFYSAMACFNLKKYEDAETSFLQVVAMDQQHLKANHLLSYIYYSWKEYSKALKCLDTIKGRTDDKAFFNKYYGFCLYNLGRFDESVEYLQVAMENSPQYAKFKKYLKGLTYENKLKEVGDVDKKIKEMEEQMMKNAPTLSECSHLSMLYMFQGEYQKAEELLKSFKGNMQ